MTFPDPQTNPLHLAVALDGYGWHRQAWRIAAGLTGQLPAVTSGRYWADLAVTAERGLLDFITIDDALTPQPGRRAELSPGRLVGRADALLTAARIAPVTTHLGLVPVATVTHTEPFHLSKAIATLDFVSRGRAGWQPRISTTAHEAALFGRRPAAAPDEAFDEAEDVVEVVRRLWDSWEDDAVIRDVGSGRYIDRDKLHYVDFAGRWFAVKGPSITPRPPQGQPLVAALAHTARAYQFGAAAADLVFITPRDDDELRAALAQLRAAGQTSVYPDLVVTFGGDTEFGSDAAICAGTPQQVAELIVRWHDLGADGVRLRPAVHARDLPVIVEQLVPLLAQTGRFRTGYRDGETLRARLGLPVRVNRYAGATVGAS